MAVSTAALRVSLGHLVHEINNRLQLVHNAASLMEIHMPSANRCGDPFVGEMFQWLKSAIEELLSLVGSLKPELESLWEVKPSLETVNLSSLIDEVLQSEAMRFEAGGIRVAKEMFDNLPSIQANKKLLKRALLNLCKNAAEAMPQGGVLTIRTRAHERSVWLEVCDTGVGIPPNIDVFQPFVTSKQGGMGLGLSITRHILEIHRGTIAYRSQPGKGTTFCLSFPRVLETQKISVRREAAPDKSAERFFG